jgi:cysteinyl-tRNA synthetase
MIERHLGETIDIHGGGLDLIFPHHENEIAQSRCAHDGAPLARYWVHNGFVDMNSEKMSKSLGNIITPAELLEQGHRGETLRLALLSAHYRQPLAWTDELLAQSKAALDSFRNALRQVEEVEYCEAEPPETFLEALRDDLNTPAAISALHDVRRILTTSDSREQIALAKSQLDAAGRILGVGAILKPITGKLNLDLSLKRLLDPSRTSQTLADAVVQRMIDLRNEYRAARDFRAADSVRDDLMAEGIILEDGPNGTTWRRE